MYVWDSAKDSLQKRQRWIPLCQTELGIYRGQRVSQSVYHPGGLRKDLSSLVLSQCWTQGHRSWNSRLLRLWQCFIILLPPVLPLLVYKNYKSPPTQPFAFSV